MEHTDKQPEPYAGGTGLWQYEYMDASKVYSAGHEALELMFKHETPPDPISYAVWFAYASNTNDSLIREIDTRLETRGSITKDDLLEMYKLYAEQTQLDEARQDVGVKLGKSLVDISQLMQKSAMHQANFGESLETSAREIDSADSAEHLRTIAEQMLATNKQISSVTSELNADLVESQSKIDSLNKKLERLEQLNLSDPLTGVANRRAFDARLKSEVEEATGPSSSFCLALVDLDHFKRVNDDWGHLTGDNILKAFAEFLETYAPPEVMVARYGGEEFAVILPQTKLVDAHNLMVGFLQKLRVEDLFTNLDEVRTGAISASIGITAYKPERSVADLITIADSHLYAAKDNGRNCVKTEGFG